MSNIFPPKRTLFKDKVSPTKSVFRFFWLALVIIIFGSLAIGNFNDFKKLTHNAKDVKFPKTENTYKNIFGQYDSTQLKTSFTYFIKNRYPIGTYSLNNSDDILVYKLPILRDKDLNLPLTQLVSFKKITSDFSLTMGSIYNATFKTANARFNAAEQKIDSKRSLVINYNAEVTNTAIITDSLISYSLYGSSISGSYDGKDFIDFAVKKLNFRSKFPLEVTVTKRNNGYYLILTFPKGNNQFTTHSKILAYLN